MLHGRYSWQLLSIIFVLMLGACGSGGGNNDAKMSGGTGGANADNSTFASDELVVGQSNNQARFDQARFSSASFAAEASSGRYGSDKFQ